MGTIDIGLGSCSTNEIRLQSGFISVSFFGAVGDGVTDDASAIQECFDYARDNDLSVEFESNKTYISSALELNFYSAILEGNGSIIKLTDASANPSFGIKCEGINGTYYETDEDIIAGDNWIDISDATFLASISMGDMILIKSDALYPGSADTVQGESNIIAEINGTRIRCGSLFYDTYLTSDNAKISRVAAVHPIIKDITIIQNEDKIATDFLYGISVTFGKYVLIENCTVINARATGIVISNSYAPMVTRCKTHLTTREGQGYGVEIVGACTNYIVDNCVLTGARHALAHNRGIGFGVCHMGLIYDVIGENIVNSHVFDTHGETNYVRFENCIAIGGIDVAQEADYEGVWDVGVTYTVGEIVSYDNIYFDCNVASSTGANPGTSSDWVYHNNLASGFGTRAHNIEIINCKIYNCSIGISGDGYTTAKENFIVDGLDVFNCNAAISITDGTELVNCVFDNIRVHNKYYKSSSCCVDINAVTFDNVKFGDISGNNIRGFCLEDLTGDLNINTLSAHGVGLFMSSDSTTTKVNIGTLKVIGDADEYVIFLRELESVDINSLDVTEGNGSLIAVMESIDTITINSSNIYGAASGLDYFMQVITSKTLSNLILNSVYLENPDTNRALIRCTGAITRGHIGVMAGDIDGEYLVSENRPGLEIVSGDFNDPQISKGTGTPEGSVTAGIGACYYRLDGGANTTLYIKEAGVGNAGWAAK